MFIIWVHIVEWNCINFNIQSWNIFSRKNITIMNLEVIWFVFNYNNIIPHGHFLQYNCKPTWFKHIIRFASHFCLTRNFFFFFFDQHFWNLKSHLLAFSMHLGCWSLMHPFQIIKWIDRILIRNLWLAIVFFFFESTTKV